MGRPRLNLIGEKCGELTVVGPNGVSDGGHTLWDCICSCGEWLIIYGSRLVSNSGTKSCRSCSQLKDIKGQRFGELVAIRRIDKKSNGMSKWLCKCSCGNFTKVSINHLTTGHTKSCGSCCRNTYHDRGSYYEGITSKGESFFFDKNDLDIVSSYNWYIDAKGYVVSKKIGKLHRLLMCPKNSTVQIDHINRNKRDCRRENLRFALNKENAANSEAYKTNKSTGHKNVYAVGNSYRVVIRKDGRARHFGYYKEINEAIKVANEARRELFGEFAYIDKNQK